ncbi:MAG TPA: L,D-transpeptidase family protein [Geminicoccaceae bacterium]|nr:L,D-transpeptidase family protein [Geminicoccaceae bacterium]
MRLFRVISLGDWTVGVLAGVVVLGALTSAPAAPQAAEVMTPPHLAEPSLVRALTVYRALSESGGWPPVPAGSVLRSGEAGERVAALRARLAREGYLPASVSQGESLFDPALERAVREFQRRHGLEVDGIVGHNTLAALNVPATARVAQIELNLARLQALPASLGDPYVAVNLAAQDLQVVEDGTIPLVSKVIVGKPSTPTPVLASEFAKVIFNPPWNVPASIAANEILPALRRDPAYLRKENMIVVGWPADPHGLAIDWSSPSAMQFAPRLRQLPGEGNALGRIKFEFPSPYAVYLHDTPAKGLFERARRTFSHGCMRMERPRDLAAYLLRDQGWGTAEVETAIAEGRTRAVALQRPIALWVLYLTAFAGADGAVHFREDVYGLDARGRIFEELGAERVASASAPTRGCRG